MSGACGLKTNMGGSIVTTCNPCPRTLLLPISPTAHWLFRMSTPETRYVAVGEAEVAYQVIGGEGPLDLVYHHGLCQIDLQWDVAPEAAFNRRLAAFSRLILFDRRGSGASERATRADFPTWEVWSEDLVAVLDAVGSQRAAIFAEAE